MLNRAIITASVALALVLGSASGIRAQDYESTGRNRALVIGGGAAAGAMLGGMLGGSKGALAGAIAGGAGGAIYDRANNDDGHYYGYRSNRDKAIIIGGGAAAGAVAGGIAGGKTGAVIGAAAGGAGGYILHKKTENKYPEYGYRDYRYDRYDRYPYDNRYRNRYRR
jgi:hypothetical protein